MAPKLLTLAAAAAVLLSFGDAASAASPPPVEGEHGMVVTGHRLASAVGADILRRGGNAVDAAVAVGYALAVVLPAAGNLGGGGFMTIRFADGRTTFLDFREKAPLAATRTMYQDEAGNVVPGLSTRGWLAVGVPGSVMGLDTALERYGSLPRGTVMAPAIALAENGFVLTRGDIELLRTATDDFRNDPASAAIFLKDGQTPYAPGDRLVQKDLAATLRLIARDGAAAVYKGPVGDAIVAASRAGGGILQKADFERYAVRELKPVECTYRGFLVISAPPPSSGGLVICEILNILEGYPLGYLGFHSAESVHYMVEAMRHAFVDRNSALGDPDFVDNPVARLLDKGYAAAIRARIDPFRAGSSKEIGPGTPPHEGAQTTHYSIIDQDGTAVAVTYTLNSWFGARVTAAGTGILLNNEMDDFTAKPGTANIYGLVQGEANAIAPGKTPLSSMSPTIVARDGAVVMVIGSPGGPRIITITLEAILNVIDHGMTVQEAIDAPRIHHQWQPDTVYVEPFALSRDTMRALAAMGYSFTEQPPWGRAEGILVGGPSLGAPRSDSTPRYFGANDNRAPLGAAVGE
ncbi:MAG: gamma-glutamyltransferase [Rhodospirillaceae bacterium]|nr:gamma-glutamyltransferase [Rhodospirillaceae bacterium]